MDSQDDSQESQDSVMTITQEKRHEILYFAYGSNLSTTQMRQRCPFSTPVGLGFLEGWRWIINERGYANVVPMTPSPGGSGGEEAAAAATKRRAWVPWAYERMHCDYLRWATPPPPEGTDDGEGSGRGGAAAAAADEPVRALVYVDRQRVTEGTPREEYVGRMEEGIRDAVWNWGLDEAYADRVMRRFWRKKNQRGERI
ncbi:hypothetical protein ACCO45_011530 [Purpureocillium lilacinum]|uniref:Uncharacterized protein n=1 Tax=Purpureocillium lilacinum TaxID=33203 RepID=A0ACC4DCL6_PURLI